MLYNIIIIIIISSSSSSSNKCGHYDNVSGRSRRARLVHEALVGKLVRSREIVVG